MFQLEYQAAAAEGALIELKLRLLVDKVPTLRSFAHSKQLENVESQVVQHFTSLLTEEDKKGLELCRQLRNKILHCDFRAARNKLIELGAEPHSGGVKKVSILRLSGAQVAQKVADASAGMAGTFESVAETPTDPGNVFGWLLEMGAAGDFRSAVEAFKKAAETVDRLSASNVGMSA
jgi:hypothetical protein